MNLNQKEHFTVKIIQWWSSDALQCLVKWACDKFSEGVRKQKYISNLSAFVLKIHC